MSKKLKIWIAGAVVLLVAGGAAVATVIATRAKSSQDAKKETPPLEFSARDIVQLAARRLTTDVTLTGSIMAVTQATVRSKLSAEVVRVFVREGDRVTVGQVVAEFDKAQLQQQSAERVATLESTKAQLAQNEKTRQANAQLVKQNFISQNAFDTTDASFRAQAAAVDVARAQLAQTELQLADAVVRAPISGFVAKRYVQPGEKLAFDAPMLAIVDLTQLEVAAQAPVADVAKAAPGAVVEIEVEGLTDHIYKGRIDRVNPSHRVRGDRQQRCQAAHRDVRQDAVADRRRQGGAVVAAGGDSGRGRQADRLGDRRRQAGTPRDHDRPSR